MLADSHCHLNLLDLSPFENNMDGVIKHAEELGVKYMLTVATDLDQHETLLGYCERYEHVYASVGQHPNDALQPLDPSEVIEKASHAKIVALGETGLDFYRETAERSMQAHVFAQHIQVAKMVNKPLIIHTRQARKETIALLQSEEARDVGGVLHCFTEDYETAEAALDLDFYISFSGIVTFKNAIDLQEVAKKIPMERMLIETDAPFLAPIPYRGKSNLPGYVRFVAEYLASLRGLSFDAVAVQTMQNAKDLFQIPLV